MVSGTEITTGEPGADRTRYSVCGTSSVCVEQPPGGGRVPLDPRISPSGPADELETLGGGGPLRLPLRDERRREALGVGRHRHARERLAGHQDRQALTAVVRAHRRQLEGGLARQLDHPAGAHRIVAVAHAPGGEDQVRVARRAIGVELAIDDVEIPGSRRLDTQAHAIARGERRLGFDALRRPFHTLGPLVVGLLHQQARLAAVGRLRAPQTPDRDAHDLARRGAIPPPPAARWPPDTLAASWHGASMWTGRACSGIRCPTGGASRPGLAPA